MASLARSGETLLLRTLNAHSRIHVVHNLYKSDNQEEEGLFKYLIEHKSPTLWNRNKLLKGLGIRPGDVIVLKQSVWEHDYPFNGFVLARNPISVYASLKHYDDPHHHENWEKNWIKNTERMIRWLNHIDLSIVADFTNRTPVEQFCLFYNRRMEGLIKAGLPIIHYEKFVTDPVSELKAIMDLLDLAYEDQIYDAHLSFADGDEGHGKINLGKPINSESIYKFRNLISREEFEEIHRKTRSVGMFLGYEMSFSKIRVRGEPLPNVTGNLSGS